MAEQTKIEGVYEIRIEQGAALREFERLKKQLDETKTNVRDLNKEQKANIATVQGLERAIRASGVATVEQAQALEKAKQKQDETNRKLSEAVLVEKALSGQTRELSNDLSGLTENSLRFRDKMAAAFATALDGTTAIKTLGDESQRLNRAMTGVEESLRGSEQQLEFLNQQYKEGAITEAKYAEQQAKVTREIEAGKAANALLKTELGEVTARSQKLEEQLAELNREFAAGKISQAEYKNSLSSIEAETRKAAEATETLGSKFDKFLGSQGKELKSNLSSLALQYVGVGAAIYGLQNIIGGAIKTIADFDEGLSKIRALGGDYAANIGAIGEAARTAGIDFGFSATQSLSAVEALAKAGLTSEQILSGGLTQSLALAAAGTIELGTAAEYVASTLSQFGLDGKDAGQVVDALSAAAIKGQGDVSDFANALKFVGPVAASLNVSVQETIGTLAVFAEQGIKGEQAGTTLRGVLSSLTSPSKEATQALRELGLVTEDGNKLFDASTGKFLGLANLSEQLKVATQGLTDEERSQALGRIFGNQQITGATVLLKEGKKAVEGWTEAVKEQGFAESVAAEKTNNYKGDVNRLKAEYDALTISINDNTSGLSTGFRIATQTLTELVRAIGGATDKSAGFFEKNANAIQVLTGLGGSFTKAFIKTAFFSEEEQAAIEKGLKKNVEATGDLAKAKADLNKVTTDAPAPKPEAPQVAQPETVLQQRERLTKALEDAKLKRDALNVSETVAIAQAEKEINAAQAQLDGLTGRTKATQTLNEAESERIRLREELTKAEQDANLAKLAPQEQEVARAGVVRDDRVATAAGDAELLIRIEADYQQTITEIRSRYALEQQAVQDQTAEQLQQSRQQRAADELASLSEIHQQEILAAAQAGEDITALIAQQEAQRAPLIAQVRQGELDALQAQFDAEYLALDGQLIAQFDRQTQFQEEYAALKNSFADDDLKAKEERLSEQQLLADMELEMEQRLQDAKIMAVAGFANALGGLAKEGSVAAKVFLGLEKAAAVAQILINAQQEIAAIALGASRNPLVAAGGPAAIAAFAAPGILAAKIRAGIGVATVVSQTIAGFDSGGTIQPSGTVTPSWGTGVKRRNGDNVLVRAGKGFVTLRTGEKVLNAEQQRELEDITHKGIWRDIGLPGARNTSGGYISGGSISGGLVRGTALVNLRAVLGLDDTLPMSFVDPRPSPQMIINNQMIAGLQEFAERPMQVAVEDIRRVERTVDVIDQHTRL